MKAISPLIATVLLIAFTVAVGGILSLWLTTFTKSQTTIVGQRSETDLQCSYGAISISDLKYSSGGRTLSGRIENTRIISLGNITLQIIWANSSLTKYNLCLVNNVANNCSSANLSLVPREVITFNVSVSSDYSKIRVYTNCSAVFDEATSADVSSS